MRSNRLPLKLLMKSKSLATLRGEAFFVGKVKRQDGPYIHVRMAQPWEAALVARCSVSVRVHSTANSC